jgi:hypothetical protein
MTRRLLLAIVIGSLPPSAAVAQDDATTLHDLVDRSEWIAVVEVLGAPADDGVEHAVRFAALGSLRGAGPPRFELREPCGRACGRALHGLNAGARLVAFLRRDAAELRLTAGNARALPPAGAALVAHVEALLRADAAQRLALLTDALASEDRRVRHDAAAILPHLAGLERAGAAQRERIAAALARACATAEPGCVGLARAAERLRLSAAREPLLQAYLGGPETGLAPLLLDVLPRLGAAEIAERLAAGLPPARAARLRAVGLLVRLRVPQADALLLAIVRGDRDRRVALAAASGLLAAGFDPAVLQREVGGDLLRQAQRQALDPRSAFRSVLKGGSR